VKSIRTNLQVWLAASILPLLLLSCVLVYFFVADALAKEFDAGLIEKAHGFTLLAEWEDEEDLDEDEPYADRGDDPEDLVHFEFAEIPLLEFEASDDAQYYQVWDATGLIYARAPSLRGADLGVRVQTTEAQQVIDLTLPDGRAGRAAILRFWPLPGDLEFGDEDDEDDEDDTDEDDEEDDLEVDHNIAAEDGDPFFVAVARSTDTLNETLAILGIILLVAGSGTLLSALMIIWFVTRRGLQPLDAMGLELQAIGEADLSQRIDLRNRPRELIPVGERLNAMLDRLNAVFERERRFTSDAAHELRTPVAELRTLAEVSLRREGLSEADQRSYSDTIEIATRMERLISTLLELSRCSSGQVTRQMQEANLASLIKNTWKPFAQSANAKGLEVHLDIHGPAMLRTDPVILGTILSNLFANAVTYTPTGGEIRLDCEERDGSVALSVSNTTEELESADLPRMFETFWRKQGRLANAEDHLGLGLALVSALTGLLEARVEGRLPTRNMFQVLLVHPA